VLTAWDLVRCRYVFYGVRYHCKKPTPSHLRLPPDRSIDSLMKPNNGSSSIHSIPRMKEEPIKYVQVSEDTGCRKYQDLK